MLDIKNVNAMLCLNIYAKTKKKLSTNQKMDQNF